MKKLFKIILVLLVVLIVAGAVGIHFFLDAAVKKAVETIGPSLTKVDVKLDSVSISLLGGSGKIKGLVIGNPEGFKAPSSISVGMASLALKPSSLLSDKIIVRSVAVEAPEIFFEQGLSGNNLTKLQHNLEAASGADAKESPKAKEAKPGKKLQVDEVVITGGKIHVTITAMGGKSATVPLPPIYLKDLGTGPEGITPVELSQKILKTIIDSSAKEATSVASDLAKGALLMTKDLGKSATGTAGKVTEGIGNLFKKKN